MAKENGLSKRILDTRLELHILEYNLRMVTITKDAIANYTHYLIKIALLPNSRYAQCKTRAHQEMKTSTNTSGYE